MGLVKTIILNARLKSLNDIPKWMDVYNGKCRMGVKRQFIGARCISCDVIFPYREKAG